MKVVFIDLDGTLLDTRTYSWDAARPAVARLIHRNVPWIIVTSQTRAEVEVIRRELGNEHPFIVENGAAAFVPEGYFEFPIAHAVPRDGYDVLEWGAAYQHVVDDLSEASRVSGCRIRGFHEMTPAEISSACNLPLEQSALAKRREYDEVFLILDRDRAEHLFSATSEKGLICARGTHFWHAFRGSDKASAVHALRRLFKRGHSLTVTIGFGDAPLDSQFLNSVLVPVVVRPAYSDQLKSNVPRAFLTEKAGPEGWSEAVLKLIPD